MTSRGHAELVAVSTAQTLLGRKNLSGCTLYSNIEPMPDVFFSHSGNPHQPCRLCHQFADHGRFSRWNVLRDTEISDVMPEAFGPVPEVIAGLCRREAEKVWWMSNPVAWMVIKHRGVLWRRNRGGGIGTGSGSDAPRCPYRGGGGCASC